MKHSYNRWGLAARARQLFLSTLVGVGLVSTAQAQFYSANGVVNTNTGYTDLGTNGTAIATANTDDANSAVTPIGFTFTMNGTAFTDFVLNTNGFVKLGTTAPATPFFSSFAQEPSIGGPLNAAGETNVLLPFNTDLEAGTSAAEYRVATTGTAPNRVCTIQWKNVSDKARAGSATGGTIAKQFANFSFQVKLYEQNNAIEYVYGTATPGASAGTNANFIVVGLKGSSIAATQVVTAVKLSNDPWNSTTFQQGVYTSGNNAHNIRSTATVSGGTPLPDAGRTYRFTLPVANDAAVTSIQGYASVIVPASNPLTLRATVRNTGTAALTTPLTVTLAISGANTFSQTQTVTSLALGGTAVVTFSGINLANVGQNTVTVSVPDDGNNGNNSVAQPMETSATTFSFATPGGRSGNSVFSLGEGTFYAVRLTLNTPRSITAVSALLSEAGTSATSKSSVGERVYAVVIDATTGALLARSADYVITAADINAFRTLTLTAPVTVPAGQVLVGMAQVPSGPVAFYPFGVQIEDPNRLNTYFVGTIGSAPQPALTGANNTFKFPFGAITAAPATTDLTVSTIQGYGSLVVPFGNPASLRAVVRNAGIAATTTPTLVTLTVSGANSATLTQTVAPLAPGASTTVTFTGLNLTNVGANTVTVSVANDDNNANNSLAQALATSATRFSLIVPGEPAAFLTGVGTATTPSTRALCAKFSVNAPRSVTAVRAFIADDEELVNEGAVVYGVVLNATTGAVIARSPDYPITDADLGQLRTFNLSGLVPAGDFLAGLAVVLQPGAPALFPLGGQLESPVRPGLYYTAGISPLAAPTERPGTTRLMLEVETSAPNAASEALRQAVQVFPNPSASGKFNVEVRGANARQALGVEVVNMLGQTVYVGTAKDNFRNAVDLSQLASGIYTLTLRNGQEYIQHKISIVK